MKTTIAHMLADNRNNFSHFLFWTYTLSFYYFTETKCSNKYGGLEPLWTYFKIPNTLFPTLKSGSMPCILCLMLCAFWCTFNTARKHNSDQWEICCICSMAKHPISNLTPVWESSWLMYFKVSTLCEQNIYVLHHLNILWSYNLIHSTPHNNIPYLFNLMTSTHQHFLIIQFDFFTTPTFWNHQL